LVNKRFLSLLGVDVRTLYVIWDDGVKFHARKIKKPLKRYGRGQKTRSTHWEFDMYERAHGNRCFVNPPTTSYLNAGR